MTNRNETSDDSTFGPTIFSYSRAQAIEDGVLVDLNVVAPEVCRQHFKYPVAMTAGAWAIVERAIANKEHHNDVNGVLHDIFWMSIKRAREIDPTTRLLDVIISGAGPSDLYTFKVVCGPGDTAAPVITIMLPDED